MKAVVRKWGWKPDLPDRRDHRFAYARRVVLAELPPRIDLRAGCSPVEDQGDLGSCTANAIIGCVEYLELKRRNTLFDLSRLFLYYHERLLEGSVREDSGAYLRDGIKVMAKLGSPHESSWPYMPAKFATKPPAMLAAEAKQHQIRDYQRLNDLVEMRSCLAMGYPFVFGFSVYESFESVDVGNTGIVNLPGERERLLGGHAVMAVGYDDQIKRFLIRNSWGPKWGKGGYFTMPYEYLSDRNLSEDFWTIRN